MSIALPTQDTNASLLLRGLQDQLASKIRHDWESEAFEQAFRAQRGNAGTPVDENRLEHADDVGVVRPIAVDPRLATPTALVTPVTSASLAGRSAAIRTIPASVLGAEGSVSATAYGLAPTLIDSPEETGEIDRTSPPQRDRNDALPPVRLTVAPSSNGLDVVIGADDVDMRDTQSIVQLLLKECSWSGITLASLKVNGQSLKLRPSACAGVSDDHPSHSSVTHVGFSGGESNGR